MSSDQHRATMRLCHSGPTRRALLKLTGAAALCLPVTAPVAQTSAMPTLGFVNSASRDASYEPAVENFLRGLAEQGFEPGRNVALEYRWADGHYERLTELVDDLVRRQVNVIAATTTPAVLAAARSKTTIPVVFTTSGDPVAMGLVKSLSRPGGNFTGATQLNVELAPKRLEVLHELLPRAHEFGLLVNPASPSALSISDELRAAAHELGLHLQILTASNDGELLDAFASIPQRRIEGLVIGSDNFFIMKSAELAAQTTKLKLPAIFQYDAFVDCGGLLSLGGEINESYRIAGSYAGRIPNGEAPAELAVQQVTQVNLILNLRTARAIGISVPETLRGRADRIVE
jgi:putative ABC transport system substrate-binding protein